MVQVSCYQEVLVLLWKIMEENPVFTEYVLKHCDVNEVGADFRFICLLVLVVAARLGVMARLSPQGLFRPCLVLISTGAPPP